MPAGEGHERFPIISMRGSVGFRNKPNHLSEPFSHIGLDFQNMSFSKHLDSPQVNEHTFSHREIGPVEDN